MNPATGRGYKRRIRTFTFRMRIKDESLQQVIAAADVVEVVGDFVSLKRRGRNYIARCPFHDEKTPSFNVNPERGIYKCFGCGKGGDTVQFVMEIEGLGFMQAIEYLAKKYSINLEFEQGGAYDQDTDTAREREALMVALLYAQGWYRKQLTDTEAGKNIALPYLKERGILPITQEEFGIGWSPDGHDAFSKEALRAGYKPDVLEAAGLSLKRDDGSLYDRFRGRVMFPIYTPSGRVVGFGGRILGKDAKLAKYVNSPESIVYQKSRILYGLWQSRQDIRKADQVFLTEGYLDVIALHQAGIPRAVASSGTSLTQEQAHLITRYTENVTVLFDGDAAGVKAALRGIDILLEEGLSVRVLNLPDGHDPDSYLKAHGSEAFLAYVKAEERDFVTFKAAILLEEAGRDPFRRAGVATEVVRTISLMPDRLKQDVLLREAARLLEVTEETLRAEAARMDKARARERERQTERDQRRDEARGNLSPAPPRLDLPPGVLPADAPPPLPPDEEGFADEGPDLSDLGILPPPLASSYMEEAAPPVGSLLENLTPEDQIALQEVEAIRLILNHGSREMEGVTLMAYILQEIGDIAFTSEPAASAMQEIQALVRSGITPGPEHLLTSADTAVRNLAQDLVMPKEVLSPHWAAKGVKVEEVGPKLAQAAYRHLCLLNLRLVKGRIAGLQHELVHASNDAEAEAVVRKYMELKAAEGRICKELGIAIIL